MMDINLLFVFGLFTSLLIDSAWWKIDFKKAEKGFEAHEHYHIGLELLLLYVFIPNEFILGMGLGFIMGEWAQHIEIHNKKVVPGHAWGLWFQTF